MKFTNSNYQPTVHNYPAYVFRLTSLLEKLGIKNAIYVHQDDVRKLCKRYFEQPKTTQL